MDDYQVRLKGILDEHFTPIIPPEWSATFSIYEIGAIPRQNGTFETVVVWVRSEDIETHIKGLMNAEDKMLVDTKERERLGNEKGYPRIGDCTVMVRLAKDLKTDADGPVELLVELFHVYKEESEAQEGKSSIEALLGEKPN